MAVPSFASDLESSAGTESSATDPEEEDPQSSILGGDCRVAMEASVAEGDEGRIRLRKNGVLVEGGSDLFDSCDGNSGEGGDDCMKGFAATIPREHLVAGSQGARNRTK